MSDGQTASPRTSRGVAGQDNRTFGYANLAVRGRLLDDIVGPQVDDALALAPDLVSIVGGGNDILRPRADIDALATRLEDAVARLRAGGADVLLATPRTPVTLRWSRRPGDGPPPMPHTSGRSPVATTPTSSTCGAWPRCATGGSGRPTGST